MSKPRAGTTVDITDLRRLALYPQVAGRLSDFHLQSVLGSAGRSEFMLSDVVYQGQQAKLVSFTADPSTKVKYWAVPDWGPSVARMEITRVVGNNTLIDTVEAQYEQAGVNKLYFPKLCVFERHVDGKHLERDEFTVTVHSLQSPIDPKVFRVDGMGMAQGSAVEGIGKDRLTWDGSKLVPYQSTAQAAATAVHPATAQAVDRRWTYTLIGVVCLLIAAIIAVEFLRRRLAGRASGE